MPKIPGAVIVASAALAISVLGAAYLFLVQESKLVGSGKIEEIPQASIERIARRGPVGKVKAQLFQMGNKRTLDTDDINYLLAAARDPKRVAQTPLNETGQSQSNWSDVDEQSTRAIALVEVSERLRLGALDEATRKEFESVLVSSLTDDHPHIRLCAVNRVGQLGMISRPDVRQKVAALTKDGDPKVADMACRAMEFAVIEGPDSRP
jgi:hypothetical protein